MLRQEALRGVKLRPHTSTTALFLLHFNVYANAVDTNPGSRHHRHHHWRSAFLCPPKRMSFRWWSDLRLSRVRRRQICQIPPPPRLPSEIQYWAGVIMLNVWRKGDSRGGIWQCANSKCFSDECWAFIFAALCRLPLLER